MTPDSISDLKSSDAEIRHIFNGYVHTLFNKKWKIADEIQEWGKKLIQQIQEYVVQQRTLLEQVYAEKVTRLNTVRDQVLEQALICEQNNDTEKLKQLINQCNMIKVELVTPSYTDKSISTIHLLAEQQITQQNPSNCNVQTTETEQSSKTAPEINSNNTDINENPSTAPSPVIETVQENDPSTTNPTRSENECSNHAGLVDKCPICFMIFSQTMTGHDRTRHVNEHYIDN